MLREQIGNYDDSSKLEFAKGHRGLMVLTITLMGYILIWAEIFAKIEGWRFYTRDTSGAFLIDSLRCVWNPTSWIGNLSHYKSGFRKREIDVGTSS
jgi:hypothetical protein